MSIDTVVATFSSNISQRQPKGPDVSECTINGKPVKAVAGQKVSQVLASARVKVTYSCRKGDCGTCELLMNGRVEKACNAKIPRGKCVIQTN